MYIFGKLFYILEERFREIENCYNMISLSVFVWNEKFSTLRNFCLSSQSCCNSLCQNINFNLCLWNLLEYNFPYSRLVWLWHFSSLFYDAQLSFFMLNEVMKTIHCCGRIQFFPPLDLFSVQCARWCCWL